MHVKILADAMGLGKTIMTIALLLVHSERSGSSGNQRTSQFSSEGIEVNSIEDNSSNLQLKVKTFPGFDNMMKQKNVLVDGGSLIVCPMTLLGQWKVFLSFSFLLF